MKHYILILALGFVFACSNEKKEDAQKDSNKEENSSSISSQKDLKFEAIQDSLASSWEKLTQNELLRIEDLNRLLLEVSYIPETNETDLSSMQELVVELNHFTYKQNEIPEFNVVAKNDERVDEIVGSIFAFTNTSLEASGKKIPFIDELKIDIRESILKTSELSTHYSQFVQDRNEYIEKNREQLESMGYKNLDTLKSFFDSSVI
jgi:hypothetical protein